MGLRDSIEAIIAQNEGNVAVALKNLRSGETLLIDEGRVFPSASTIKLVIMSRLMQEVKEGKRSLGDLITLRDDMRTGGDGILKELEPGHRFSLKELMTLMIVMSDNMATNILIGLTGMDAVNARAAEMGLRETKLQRRMMDSEARKAGRDNYTCAADMFRIMESLYEGRDVDRESSDLMLGILKRQQAQGRIDLYLPVDDEGIVIAHKTGDLDRLEHDVGIVYLPRCEYILCVLTSGTRTNKDGREIIGKISRSAYEAYR